MTKKLLPTMLGAVLAGGMTAAAADVSVMGHLDYAIVNFDDGTNPGLGGDDTNFRCTTCSVGFKGSEDLGNGLKAIFKIDFQFDGVNRNANGSITDRDQWVGLAGGFGKVRVGTISTVYKSHGAMIDPLYRTALQGRSYHLQSDFHNGAGEELLANGSGGGGARADNTVRWDSADYNGVKLGAHYTLDSTELDGEDNNPFGIGASYSNGGILVFADYITNDGSSSAPAPGGIGEIEGWKIGGKYTMNNIAVMGQFEDGSDDTSAGGGNNVEATNWHIAGTYTMGNNEIYAAYGMYDEETDGVDTEETESFTIALQHYMSKRTRVYVGYNNQDDDDPDNNGKVVDEDTFALGIKHKF